MKIKLLVIASLLASTHYVPTAEGFGKQIPTGTRCTFEHHEPSMGVGKKLAMYEVYLPANRACPDPLRDHAHDPILSSQEQGITVYSSNTVSNPDCWIYVHSQPVYEENMN